MIIFYFIINGQILGSNYYSFFAFTTHIYFIYPKTYDLVFWVLSQLENFYFIFIFVSFGSSCPQASYSPLSKTHILPKSSKLPPPHHNSSKPT